MEAGIATGDTNVTSVLGGPCPALVWPLTDTEYVPVASSANRVANVTLVIKDFDCV